MKYLVQILTMLCLLSTASVGMADDTVVAVINGVNVTNTDLDNHIKLIEKVTRKKIVTPEERRAALENLIEREVLFQEAIKKKIQERDDIKFLLAFERQELFTKTLLSEQESIRNISDEELKKLYDEKIKSINMKEYKVRHIVFKLDDANAKKQASTVIAQLDAGKDFIRLAKKESQGPSAPKGGDIGWLSEAELRGMPALAQALSEMKKGTYSKKPVKSNIGWHVLKLEDVRRKQPAPFEQTKDKLRAFLQQQKARDYIKRLVKDANIEIKMPASKSK